MTSGTATNGSAFAGLTFNTDWYNTGIGIVMLLGRYVPMHLRPPPCSSVAGPPATEGDEQCPVGAEARDAALAGPGRSTGDHRSQGT